MRSLSPRTRWRLLPPTALLLVASGLAAGPAGPAAAAAPPDVTVTVNARAALATVPDTGIGVNDAVWDSQLGTPAVSGLLADAGVRVLRYPGGSYGDIYHWQTHTAPGGFVAQNTDFDTFMASTQRIGAQPMIIANYGTGSPQEAADWVRYANVTKGYGARLWEIGNEIYGNGHYGADWEADDHADKSPTAYGNEVVAYADAMKAVDPSVRVGAVLTMPAAWPDGIVAGGDAATWNQTVLSIAGSKIDFVVLHWYPSDGDAAGVLARPAQLADGMYLLREQLRKYAGADADRIGIAVTETSSAVARDTQPGALFLADTVSTLLENGVFTVDWWNVHNGIERVSTVDGQTDYQDWGLLSSAGCLGDTCEPALNTPFAAYHGMRLLSRFARPGDLLVRAGTDQPLVSAHAALRPDGDLAVLLVNKDPANAHDVALDYAGFVPATGAPTVLSFAPGDAAVSTGTGGTATTRTLSPYSLTALVLHPAAAGTAAPRPLAPRTPRATAVTDRSVTLSWLPSPIPPRSGTPPALPYKYEVYRQLGTTSEQVGETTDTSLTVPNLVPGSRYTFNVLTRDAAGQQSASSMPVTVTTGTPATSACAVRLTDTSNWGSGFVGSIDITNTGTAPLDGWTLAYRWPTGWQHADSGWNGTWTQTGTAVTVTNADFNRTLAPGSTANVGFVGSYTGPNILPTAFTLNGTVCS
jgi:Cellulose binding domain/Fibronectin type III domain